MSRSRRTSLSLFLIAMTTILVVPAFSAGLWVGLLALILPLTAAVVVILRPRDG